MELVLICLMSLLSLLASIAICNWFTVKQQRLYTSYKILRYLVDNGVKIEKDDIIKLLK